MTEERQNKSYEEFLNFLLIYKKHGGKLDDVDRNGNTPLMLFLKHGLYDFDNTQDKLVDLRDEIVSLLACDGSTVRKRNNTGLSAIHIVSSKGWLSTMKILVQKGANISEKDDKHNRCLHLSHMGENGADPNHYTDGEPPILLAIKSGHTDIVKYLIEKGANFHSCDRKENTTLHIACDLILRTLSRYGPFVVFYTQLHTRTLQ
ncbi:serine/threonine-protein phosphatase 6 regulatory ankyrin repeat subunit A-like [Saccostrea cucullata]|uniref:serine/threonine-protein phosphatase 6 regulatory ankyrin repeat subunit A-like n=1 Tax=Saccostrea cuccullata TaxID=36930 RepID=UPI002ED49C0D